MLVPLYLSAFFWSAIGNIKYICMLFQTNFISNSDSSKHILIVKGEGTFTFPDLFTIMPPPCFSYTVNTHHTFQKMPCNIIPVSWFWILSFVLNSLCSFQWLKNYSFPKAWNSFTLSRQNWTLSVLLPSRKGLSQHILPLLN